MRILSLILILALLLGGCSSVDLKSYVAADRATYSVIAPDYIKYVSADKKLTQDQKKRRARLLETWRLRIESGEKEKQKGK